MASYLTQPQHQAAVSAARVRSAFACAMAPRSMWSVHNILGITTDHKPERPRRLRVHST
jgi:hypothetical protein